MNAQQSAVIKQQTYQIINKLPPSGFDELVHFLDYLKYKYEHKIEKKVIALKGLWADVPLDITDQDVRRLRQQSIKSPIRKGSSPLFQVARRP